MAVFFFFACASDCLFCRAALMQIFKRLRIADGGILILMTIFNVEEHPLKAEDTMDGSQ